MMRAAVLFAVCLSLSACANVQCARNTDCGDHSRCELNRCVSDCAADRDCPSGLRCDLNGACVAMPDAKVTDVSVDLADTPVSTDAEPADVGADVVRDSPVVDVPLLDAKVVARDGGNERPDVAPLDVAADVTADVAAVDGMFDAAEVADAHTAVDASDAVVVGDAADASGCVRTFACEAVTADAECGVVTSAGRRHPDLGRPYCADRLSREGCSCHLLRCVSPAPLCAGTYVATFRERLVSGCNGVAGELSGTCNALWNVVQTWPAASVLSDRTMYNVYLSWSFTDYTQTFTVTSPAQVRLVVQQSTWFSDVSGVGNSGRSEVARVSVAPSP